MQKSQSAFVKVLGGAPYIKILDFLLAEGRILDYSLTDISKHTGVAWSWDDSEINNEFKKLQKTMT